MQAARLPQVFATALAIATLTACASQPIASLKDGKLAPCSGAPRCVNSDQTEERHAIAAFAIQGDAAAAWRKLKTELGKLPRTEIAEERNEYLHAVSTTAILRFKDDLEFALRPSRNEIGVRSSSRVGYYDFDVNRERIEALRAALKQQGAVKQ
jgi:uncharacterized protein (DUF1499 family)